MVQHKPNCLWNSLEKRMEWAQPIERKQILAHANEEILLYMKVKQLIAFLIGVFFAITGYEIVREGLWLVYFVAAMLLYAALLNGNAAIVHDLDRNTILAIKAGERNMED